MIPKRLNVPRPPPQSRLGEPNPTSPYLLSRSANRLKPWQKTSPWAYLMPSGKNSGVPEQAVVVRLPFVFVAPDCPMKSSRRSNINFARSWIRSTR